MKSFIHQELLWLTLVQIMVALNTTTFAQSYYAFFGVCGRSKWNLAGNEFNLPVVKYFCLPTQLLIFSQVSRKKKLRIKVVWGLNVFRITSYKDASHLKEGETNHFYSHNFDALGRNGIKYEKQYISDHYACSPWIYFTLILI